MTDEEFDDLLGKLQELTPEQRKMASAQLALTRTRDDVPTTVGSDLETTDSGSLVWTCSQKVAENLGLGMVHARPGSATFTGGAAYDYTVVADRLVQYVVDNVSPRSYDEKWRAVHRVVSACFHTRPFPRRRTITVALLTDRLADFEAALSLQYPGYAAAGQLRFALL